MKGERFFFFFLDSNTAPTKVSQQIREKKKKVKSFFGKYVREQNFRLNPSIGIES